MKSAVIIFPGSNCDRDIYTVMEANDLHPHKVWHGDSTLPDGLDVIAVPGGFSYGDYLRAGAMAAHSPIMKEVVAFANKGGLVLGVCNGFQILTECKLLPGTLMQNNHLKFNCQEVLLRVDNTDSAFTRNYTNKQVINVPIAHHEGNYFAEADTVKAMEDNQQIA
ncbi:MAG: phosphoribosylformylglycinamidine synthase I, partial [Rickettsiales bacterium]|nr:phosphoribosylformylglycinamidine synthase I [Rickettsiales bacterium]